MFFREIFSECFQASSLITLMFCDEYFILGLRDESQILFLLLWMCVGIKYVWYYWPGKKFLIDFSFFVALTVDTVKT